MTFGVRIKTVTGRDRKVRKIYEYLRFIDSFKFLTTSLEKLVANLPASAFAIFDSMFDSDQSDQQVRLKRKEYTPIRT